uniref:FLYWCH-type domain-containing protein n=1 Tax=Rhabditophanes sp. KR3021 TaxID=114890 RepID=A0AC35UFZ0_9BILA
MVITRKSRRPYVQLSQYPTKELAFEAASANKCMRIRKGLSTATPTFNCRFERCDYAVTIKKVGYQFGIFVTENNHQHDNVDITSLTAKEFMFTRKLDIDDFALKKTIEFKKAGAVTTAINNLLQNDTSVRCNITSKQLKNKIRNVQRNETSNVSSLKITTLDQLKYAYSKRNINDCNNSAFEHCFTTHIVH